MPDSYLVGAKRLTIGLSTTIGFTASSFENGFILKKIGTSGVVEIVDGISFVVGSGYPIDNGEIVSVKGAMRFFLAASGFTQVVAIAKSYSAGATGLPTLPPAAPSGLL